MSEEIQDINSPVVISGHSQVAHLIRRMDEEMRSSTMYNGYIDELQLLVSNRENSEFKGLGEKLKAVGRGEEVEDAEFDLQIFEMVLDKLTHYPSAQKLFFYFLSRILNVFRSKIMPKTANLDRDEVESIIEEHIVKPTLAEMNEAGGYDHLIITHSHIRGMIYWLAERCHVRWQTC